MQGYFYIVPIFYNRCQILFSERLPNLACLVRSAKIVERLDAAYYYHARIASMHFPSYKKPADIIRVLTTAENLKPL